MRLIILLLLAFPAFAHQYTALDDLVADVCSQHTFDKCSDPIIDSDGDGIPDDIDECPQDPTNTCNEPPPPTDTDGDGITDDVDQCPNTPAGATVDATGCEVVIVPPPEGHTITNAVVGVWGTLPNTKLIDLVPPEAQGDPYRFLGSAKSILTAWNGASWDEARSEMHVIASGGHADYCGNQHFKLGVDSEAWELVRPHSTFDGVSPGETFPDMFTAGMTPDGNPISRHTYGGTVYAPNVDKHYVFPGSNCSGAGGSDGRVWSANTGGTTELVSTDWSGARNQAVYDSVTERVFVGNYGRIYSLDPTTNTIATEKALGGADSPWDSFKLGIAIDTDRRMIVLTGGNRFITYDIETHTLIKHTDLGNEFKTCYGPGWTFVDSQDKYLAWCGGNIVYWVDPVTFAVTEQLVTGTAPNKSSHGMFGRFQWSEKYGAIIIPDTVYEDVKYLKL